MMRKSNYNKFPTTKVNGQIHCGWSNIIDVLKKELQKNNVVSIDMYTGVHYEEIANEILKIAPDKLIETKNLFKSKSELDDMTKRFMTDDVLFGYITNLNLSDYFDQEKLLQTKETIQNSQEKIVILGHGASLVAPLRATRIYIDMARWEIIQRMRAKSVEGLGMDNRQEDYSFQYKRGYFNDWRILDQHKDSVYKSTDYWIDTHTVDKPKMINKSTFWEGMNNTANTPFRVVPFFDTAPWGGQWMKDVCDLNRDVVNFGWCFDCVPEENSLLLEVDGEIFEMPSINLVRTKTKALLGEPVESRFGKEFPIRFDFLDTFGGGNLSLQVHPTTQFIREQFGMQYTQDESYYMIDANPNAVVYLGLKNGIDKDAMMTDLEKAEKGELVFEAEKYVNKIPAKKHDHFLIPGGTVHCSGPEGLVLEISSTPNLFTFKLWDWERLGLDGKPRPINVDRGRQVIDWKRDTDYTFKNLVNAFSIVAQGDGWKEEKTGLHPNEFIETRRHSFTKPVHHSTNNSVNVLNLIEGEEAIVESPTNAFEPFVIHYAETFIIPAQLGEYTISPFGKSEGQECMTIKAYIRFEAK